MFSPPFFRAQGRDFACEVLSAAIEAVPSRYTYIYVFVTWCYLQGESGFILHLPKQPLCGNPGVELVKASTRVSPLGSGECRGRHGDLGRARCVCIYVYVYVPPRSVPVFFWVLPGSVSMGHIFCPPFHFGGHKMLLQPKT